MAAVAAASGSEQAAAPEPTPNPAPACAPAAVAPATGSELPGPAPNPAPACPPAAVAPATGSELPEPTPNSAPIHLGVSAHINQPFNNIFLLQQISASQNQPDKNDPTKTLDPKLLMAARRGDWKELEHLLQHNGADGSEDRQGQATRVRPGEERSGTPTTAAAASTTTSAAPSTSISQPHTILEMEQGQDTPPLPPRHDDDAAAQQPPAVPPAAGSSAVLDADGVTMEGDSLLHVVASSGDSEDFRRCAKMIVRNKKRGAGAGDATTMDLAKRRALLEARNYKGDTPLHCAARAGNTNMIGRLVGLLTDAAAAGDKEAVKTKFLGMKNKCGETALHEAVRAGSKDVINELLKVDPGLECSNRVEDAGAACSPFFLAVSLWGYGREDDEMDMARHLFKKTSDSIRSNLSFYCSGPDGRNVLHAAVSRGTVETVIQLSDDLEMETRLPGRLLLSQMASQKDKENGSTPLHLAASLVGLPSSYQFFPLQIRPPTPGTTPLSPLSSDAASKSAQKEVARQIYCGPRYWQIHRLMLFLVLNANVAMAYQPDKAGMYPIHVAAGSGSIHAVTMLLLMCQDCATVRDAKGRTLLHVAAEEGRLEVVKYVCRQSSGLLSSIVNAQDMNGDTPLHRAVHAAQPRVVRRLIQNQQVRLDVPNNEGMRPIDVSWTTLPREAYYAWDSRLVIRRSLLRLGAPYGENNRGDLFRKNCLSNNQDEEKMSENLTAAAQVLALFSVLITTVAFSSAFTLPGGNRSAGDAASVGGVAGTPVLGGPRRSYAFEAFILADALAFALSLLATTILLYAGVPARSLDNRFRLINEAYGFMWQAGRSLLAAFGLGLFIVLLPVARSIAIAVVVLMILLVPAILKESEGFNSLDYIPMVGIARSRPLSARDRVLGLVLLVINNFWSYILIFGIPAIRRWPKFTLSPY